MRFLKQVSRWANGRAQQFTGLLFVLPAVAFVTVFFLIPLGMTMWMSLHDWPLFGETKFIGIKNYMDIADDEQFIDSLRFTIRYTLYITPVIFIFAFALALLVKQEIPGIGFFRTVYFLPVVIGLSVSSFLWVWLLNGRVGLINQLFLDLGLISEPRLWLTKRETAMYAVIASVVWKTVGLSMVLLLAGMQAISKDLYEAAAVDGANYIKRLRYITIPLLRRTFALALVLSVIGSFLAFDQFYIMTQGGPRNSTITIVHWIFNNSFTYFRLGYGAAMSIVLLAVLIVLSVAQLYLLRDDSR